MSGCSASGRAVWHLWEAARLGIGESDRSQFAVSERVDLHALTRQFLQSLRESLLPLVGPDQFTFVDDMSPHRVERRLLRESCLPNRVDIERIYVEVVVVRVIRARRTGSAKTNFSETVYAGDTDRIVL